jgi:hypothetical protein
MNNHNNLIRQITVSAYSRHQTKTTATHHDQPPPFIATTPAARTSACNYITTRTTMINHQRDTHQQILHYKTRTHTAILAQQCIIYAPTCGLFLYLRPTTRRPSNSMHGWVRSNTSPRPAQHDIITSLHDEHMHATQP